MSVEEFLLSSTIFRMETGDVVSVKVKSIMPREEREKLRAALKKCFPGHMCIILNEGETDIEIIRKAEKGS